MRLTHWIDGEAREAAQRPLARRHRSRHRRSSFAQVAAGDAARRRSRGRGRASARSRPGPRCPTASARAGWSGWPTRSKRGSTISPTPNRATAASRCALARDVEIPRAISNLRFFAARGDAVRQRIAPRPGRAELHAAPAARRGRLRSRRGTCRCTCSPGRSRRRSRPATRVVAKPSEITPLTRDDARRTRRAKSVSRRACSTSCTASAPRSASRWSTHPRIEGDLLHRQHGGRPAHRRRSPRRCSRRCRWSWAARTRRSSSPTATGERHLDTIVRSAFQNSGQICLCGSRILVERRIYAEFRDAFVERALAAARRRSARRGHRTRPAGVAGALRQGRRRHRSVRATKAATCCCGGDALRAARGWFVAPTVIEGLGPDCAHQSRGDLRPGRDAAALRRRRGSAARWPTPATTAWPRRVWTRDLNRAHRVAARTARRHGLDQHLADARPAHAVRRHGPVRPGPRRRHGSDAFLHRSQERRHCAWDEP